ncbi:hypothetical protein DP116_14430 [Brasilonema bromeliae SPC951]|uniref:Uncharacterized protein n=1 Tax=Brasilonema bromeliae SPC951 TaxID=385972 RepID=A0ABX1P9V9_9CYAN|nr:hypothetical protein [Brasilonema bromeliae SPC951]
MIIVSNKRGVKVDDSGIRCVGGGLTGGGLTGGGLTGGGLTGGGLTGGGLTGGGLTGGGLTGGGVSPVVGGGVSPVVGGGVSPVVGGGVSPVEGGVTATVFEELSSPPPKRKGRRIKGIPASAQYGNPPPPPRVTTSPSGIGAISWLITSPSGNIGSPPTTTSPGRP